MPDQNGALTTDERTTPLGLYHYAVSYEVAANCLLLEIDRRQATHLDAPIDHLFTHSIELFMKAFLRLKGASLEDLKFRLGHAIPKLGEHFENAGGQLDDEDREVFALLTPENVFGARYIVTGPFTRASSEALSRTANSLHETVRKALSDEAIYTRF